MDTKILLHLLIILIRICPDDEYQQWRKGLEENESPVDARIIVILYSSAIFSR